MWIKNKVARTSVNITVSGKWAKFQFWVSYLLIHRYEQLPDEYYCSLRHITKYLNVFPSLYLHITSSSHELFSKRVFFSEFSLFQNISKMRVVCSRHHACPHRQIKKNKQTQKGPLTWAPIPLALSIKRPGQCLPLVSPLHLIHCSPAEATVESPPRITH